MVGQWCAGGVSKEGQGGNKPLVQDIVLNWHLGSVVNVVEVLLCCCERWGVLG